MSVRQMTSQTLNALKGWPHFHAVDFEGRFSASIPEAELPVPKGAVVSLDDDGNMIPGVGTAATMPMFNFYPSNELTVKGNGGDPSQDRGAWVPITPTGVGLALPAVGAFELTSTHFDNTGVYLPGKTFLTSPASGSANAGLITVGNRGTDMIVGVVSRGVIDNGYGHPAVAFWPHPIFPNVG